MTRCHLRNTVQLETKLRGKIDLRTNRLNTCKLISLRIDITACAHKDGCSKKGLLQIKTYFKQIIQTSNHFAPEVFHKVQGLVSGSFERFRYTVW